MITLDNFFDGNILKIPKQLKNTILKEKQIFKSKTRKEWTKEDLPEEIRKNPRKWLETIEKQDLSEGQRKMVEIIKEGIKHKEKKGNKTVTIEDVKAYQNWKMYNDLYQSIKKERRKNGRNKNLY